MPPNLRSFHANRRYLRPDADTSRVTKTSTTQHPDKLTPMTTAYMILPTEDNGYVVRTRLDDGRVGLIEGFRTFDEAKAWIANRKALGPETSWPSSTLEW